MPIGWYDVPVRVVETEARVVATENAWSSGKAVIAGLVAGGALIALAALSRELSVMGFAAVILIGLGTGFRVTAKPGGVRIQRPLFGVPYRRIELRGPVEAEIIQAPHDVPVWVRLREPGGLEYVVGSPRNCLQLHAAITAALARAPG
jgi:hypothetical protein